MNYGLMSCDTAEHDVCLSGYKKNLEMEKREWETRKHGFITYIVIES